MRARAGGDTGPMDSCCTGAGAEDLQQCSDVIVSSKVSGKSAAVTCFGRIYVVRLVVGMIHRLKAVKDKCRVL